MIVEELVLGTGNEEVEGHGLGSPHIDGGRIL